MRVILHVKFIQKYFWLLGVAFVVLVHLPFFILSQNAYINYHDNLDSDFLYLHILKLTDNLLTWDGIVAIENIFNGLPRGAIHSEFSFLRVLFYIFPSFWAYVVNSIIIRLVGFLGMSLLARKYFLPFNSNASVLATFICSVVFVLLPILSIYGLTTMGQPLLLWAFLNLLTDKKLGLYNYVIILLFPFYSHFALSAPFILIGLFFLGLIYFYRTRQVAIPFIIGLFCLFLSYLIANKSLIINFIDTSMVSHRVDFSPSMPTSFIDGVKDFLYNLFMGQFHASLMNLVPLFLLFLYSMFFLKRKGTYYAFIYTVLVAIAVLNTIYRPVVNALDIQFLKSFQFNRFTILYPILVFSLILLYFKNKQIKNGWVYLTLFGLLLTNPLKRYQEIGMNWVKLVPVSLISSAKYPAFNEFYAIDLFTEIKEYIGKPPSKFRVVSVGLHPAVALYNGFYTLDSYQNNYPLAYKKSFREIIADELEKSPTLQTFFDDWGNMCYIMSADLEDNCQFDCHKHIQIEPIDLAINIEKLREMGAEYIISAVPINTEKLPITPDKTFTHENSRWKIYLYKI